MIKVKNENAFKVQRLSKKFASFVRKEEKNGELKCNFLPIFDKWLVNTTNHVIPKEVQRVLQLGGKVAIEANKLPFEKIITDVEFAINQSKVPETRKEKLCQTITHHLHQIKKCPQKWH